jgi:hypothetical protein
MMTLACLFGFPAILFAITLAVAVLKNRRSRR